MPNTQAEVSESAVHVARDVRVVFSRLRRRLKQTYDTRGITPSQTAVMSRISKDGPASSSRLAAAERVRPQSMAATLAALEERGFIARQPDPDDGRSQQVSLSQAGHTFLSDKRQASEEWLARAAQDHLTETERRTVVTALALLDRLSHQ